MSLTSLFLSLLLVPMKSKPAPPTKTARELELEDEIRRLSFALTYWRETASAIQLHNERLIRERDRERLRPDIIRNCSPDRSALLRNPLAVRQLTTIHTNQPNSTPADANPAC
jgi:hypothetical protein